MVEEIKETDAPLFQEIPKEKPKKRFKYKIEEKLEQDNNKKKKDIVYKDNKDKKSS